MKVSYRLTEEQELLAKTARRFLEERAGMDVVRELMMTDDAFDRDLWQAAAGLGWMSLAIPEQYGGSGYTFAELSVILEEQGRALFCGPFFASVVLAANAILEGGGEEQKAALLPGIASGDTIATLALAEHHQDLGPASISASAEREGDGWTLDGTKRYVLGAAVADLLVVAARTGDGTVGLFVVPTSADGVTIERTPTLDATRKQADVHLSGVRVEADALLGGHVDAWAVVERVLALASAGIACEQVGVARRCLEMAADYAKTRFQFGRAIGSFQAVKHRLADDLVAVEHAHSTAYHAARTTADPEEFAIAAPLAKAVCSDAVTMVTGDNIQVHGGIGFTWEHDAHLYFKRAKSTALLFGTARHHRTRLAEVLGL